MSRFIYVQQPVEYRRWKCWLLSWLRLWQALVEVLSFCYLSSDSYSDVLFSEWLEE